MPFQRAPAPRRNRMWASNCLPPDPYLPLSVFTANYTFRRKGGWHRLALWVHYFEWHFINGAASWKSNEPTAISIPSLIWRDWFRYLNFTRSKVKYQRWARENPAKHRTKHWRFLVFAPTRLVRLRVGTETTLMFAQYPDTVHLPPHHKNKSIKTVFKLLWAFFFRPYLVAYFGRVDGPSRRGAHVALKRPRTRRAGRTRLVFRAPARWERLHLLALLADVCVTWTASICSQAFPWDMELVVSGKSD